MIAIAVLILASLGAGAWAEGRWGPAAQRAGNRALDILIYGLVPLVTFFTVSHVKLTAGVGAGLALGWTERLTVIALAWVIGTRVLRLPRPGVGALMVTVGIANTGYLGVPLITVLLGGEPATGQAITYDVAVSAPVLLLIGFAIGAAFGTRAGNTPRERLSAFLWRNPPLFAFVAALIAPGWLTPDWAQSAAEVAVFALAPLGFFALGVNLMHEQEDGVRVFPPPLTPPIGVALGLRLLVAPGVMLAGAALVGGVPDAFQLQAGMACGINGLAVAHLYGLDLRIVAGAIAWSTAIVLAVATAVVLL